VSKSTTLDDLEGRFKTGTWCCYMFI